MQELRKDGHNDPTMTLHATACEAKASEATSTLEWVVKILSIQENPLPWGMVQSQAFTSSYRLSISYRRQKVTLLAYHHYFYSLILFVLNLTSKKINQDGFLPPHLFYISYGETKIFLHAHRWQDPPLFKA